MRKIIVLILMVACMTSFARLRSVKVCGTPGNPIPNSYDLSDPQSATMQCEGVRHLMVWNETGSRIRVHPVKTTATPSDSVPDFVWVPATSQAAWDFLPVADDSTIFIRSDESAITDTKCVDITCW